MSLKSGFYNSRESICVSHYPCLTHPVEAEEAMKELNLESNNNLNSKNGSIYIHIPFCDKICKFCPFNKFPKIEESVKKYLNNLYKEIDLYAEKKYIQDTKFKCIALGGGTPTCLSKEQLSNLINYCKSKFNFEREMEISLEGNPENSDFEKLKALVECGVNRISFGIQTFDESLNSKMELQHSVQEGIEAIKNAHNAGINNVGIDLMYNLPGQTNEQFLKDLQTAFELGVEHITLFSLNIPPKTRFHQEIENGKIEEIGDVNREIELYSLAEKFLLSIGYEQYSVYDFALPNKINLHAKNYFSDQCDLLGLGAAAFGYLNDYMYINYGKLEDYGNQICNQNLPIIYGQKANEEDKKFGCLVKGFRMLSVSKSFFEAKFNEKLEEYFKSEFEELKSENLIYEDDYSITLTKKGRVYGNNICQYLIQDKFKNDGIIRHMLTKGVRPEKF